MNRKTTLILALLILAVISVSIAAAVNDTDEAVAADDSDESISQDDTASDDKLAVGDDDVQSAQDTDTLGAGGLTVTKVWKDNDNAQGKRPDSIKFKVIEDGKEIDTSEIRQNMSWKATLDLRISQDSTYEVAEVDVPEGYEANVTGSVEEGFVITNTLKDVPKNDTDKNTTPTDKDPDNKKPVNDNSKKSEPKKKTTVTTKTTTKEVPAKKQAKNDTKKQNKHDTGNPIIIGIVAVALLGLAYALYRRQ